MVHLMADGTEGGKPLRPLHLRVVVVVPDRVTFDRSSATGAGTDLAPLGGFGGDASPGR